MKQIIISLSLIFFSISAIAIVDNDTTHIDLRKEQLQFSDNLDSLLNLWHVKHSLKNNYNDTLIGVTTDSTVPSYPDSIYVERLKNLQSAIPYSYNSIVKNFILMYANKRREQVEVMLGLSKYYFPMFEKELDEQGMPLELKYLPVIESALNPQAVSRVGATGLWQFIYSTGKMYGLEITSFVDERKNPEKATKAAVKYLKDLHNIYNDWTLALAAYNCGPGNVNKAIRRSGGKRDFWDIYYRLPRETRGYVPAFIAANYIMTYYEKHNLAAKRIDFSVSDTILINKELHLKQVAEVLKINLEQLRELNPEYKEDIIPGVKKEYTLALPTEQVGNFIDLQDSIFAYKDSIFFNPIKTGFSPQKYSASKYLPGAPSKNHKKIVYKVKSGDNIGFIASWYGVKKSQVRYWNNIRRNLIREGQKLTIYVPKSKYNTYKKVDNMSFAQKQKSIGKTYSAKKISTTKKQSKGGKYVWYTVKSGDNFWTIAKKFPGVSNKDIMHINGISNAKRLSPGIKIKIKRKS